MNKRLIICAIAFIAINVDLFAQRTSTLGRPKLESISSASAATTDPSKENIFSPKGFSGIGTLSPTAPFEIKKGVGNTRNKNVLLKLSNEWADGGQNEPSIMFSNGDITNPKNVSYWTIGARVSGDNVLKTPQTFKISHKAGVDAV